MPQEVTDWKAPDCVWDLDVSGLSNRETSSPEINGLLGEGGALNADYRTVEAVAMASNLLGLMALKYGTDFRFKTGGGEQIRFDFSNETIKETARRVLANFLTNPE